MSKRVLIDSIGNNIISAIEENGKLLEYQIEDKKDAVVVGSIFKGKVEAVLNGMQAAFVNVGLAKNGYLYIGDMLFDKTDLIGQVDLPEVLNLNVGDEILVQAVKDPVGNKGVRLTSQLSFVGRYVVYMPDIDFVGVSRKIVDEKKRDRLTSYAQSIKVQKGGFIVRTAAENATRIELKRDADGLIDCYKAVLNSFKDAPAGTLLYEEGNLASRTLRDLSSLDIDEFIVGDKELYESILEKTKKRSRDVRKRIQYFNKPVDMFKYYKLSTETEKLLRNKVELESGAYLIIDRTEALTVIDVNTGKYVGSNNLEETVFNTNVLAAKEIARQVRLRNIGGIVVVDFIDMENAEHRQKLLEELEEALKADRTKCNVIGMTGLGLVEFTRKKKRRESASLLVQPCPYCKGDGNIYSDDYIIMKIRTALLDLFADGYNSAIIDLNVNVANVIMQNGTLKKDVTKIWKNKRVYIVPHKTYHHEFFLVKGDNSPVLDLPDNAMLLY